MSAPTRRPPARVQPSRRVAYEVVHAVSVDDAYANLLLPSRIAEAALSPADAGFATELAYGTLRRRGTWDRVIESAAGRPVDDIDPVALDVLRLGVHQLLGMRVAQHAAVDEAVGMVRLAGSPRAAGFVNGVLRRVTTDDAAGWIARIAEPLRGDARLGAEWSHPAWVVGALRDALAADGHAGDGLDGELLALLEADNTPPQVAVVALPGLADPADLARPGQVSPLAGGTAGGDPAAEPFVRDGRVRVQDEGSQLTALALSRARPIVPGERWLDLCAGPGGKAALLGAEAAVGGATLVANELMPARAGLVRRAVEPISPPVEVVMGDARRFADAPERFDRILLDAPCTGLGALRRRPEARWRKTAADVGELAALQGSLLDAAVGALAPGGLLAYVTCSPHVGETREVVAAALDRHPGLTALDTPTVLQSIAIRDLGLPAGTAAQLWPHRHGTDAMFVQLLTISA